MFGQAFGAVGFNVKLDELVAGGGGLAEGVIEVVDLVVAEEGFRVFVVGVGHAGGGVDGALV
jgi:hypothetical protein